MTTYRHDFRFLYSPAEEVAPQLLGCVLERRLEGQIMRGRIVECEAYDQSDAASHSFNGQTPRTATMFGPPGYLYVYFTYGMHYCCNIVTGPEGHGSAVLIRALEPISGRQLMEKYRPQHGINLTNGPAKLCQALMIDKTLNGHDLSQPSLRLLVPKERHVERIVQTTRIGITRAIDIPWRFYIASNAYVSKA